MKIKSFLCSLLLAASVATSGINAATPMATTNASEAIKAPSTTDWYPITTENRPFVRWWWLGSAVDPEGLTFNLSEFARKGLGGVEITPIYGVMGNEANDIEYLSPQWMRMLSHTINEADRLGLQVDMNNGTGWPFGGPEVGTKYGARKRIVERWTVAPGHRLEAKIEPSDKRQLPVATLQAIIAANGDLRMNITDRLRPDGTLDWKAPKAKSDWQVYAIFSGRTFQMVKRAAPGGEGYVVNHYDSVAVNHYFDRFEQAFKETGAPLPDTFFNDSYEVYGSDWADNILEEFAKDHGYRLELYIAEFADNDNTSELRRRVVRDYRSTLARMLRENFTDIWLKRAHEAGVRVRNQSHGSPANIIDLYAAVDIPECESFGQTDFNIPGLVQDGPSRPSDSDPAVLKFASSAAHVSGKKLTSAETLTWLTEHFRTSLSRCKPEIDQMLCSGVNHVYFHGAPYSPKDAEFPGYMFYAAINMSPTNSIWQDADSLFGYIARAQSFLTAGTPDNDFLLYFPLEEVWMRQDGAPYLMFDIHKMNQRMPDIKEAVGEIMRAGYDTDYISDALLDSLSIKNNMLCAKGGAAYPALIVPSIKYIQPSTLSRILDLCRKGGKVMFIGGYPSDVPGLANLEERRDSLHKLLATLPEFASSAAIHSYGKGELITAPSIREAVALSGVTPEKLRRDYGVSMLRRNNETGGHNYFLTQLTDRPIDGFVPLASRESVVEIFDPLTGRRGMAETAKDSAGSTLVRLQMRPGESLLLKTFARPQQQVESWGYIEAEGDALNLENGWSIEFLRSEPPIEGVFRTDSLVSWTELPIEEAKVNFGTARYSVSFDLPADVEADDWILNLGDLRESADVKVNGVSAGKVWSVPFTLRIGKFLRPGRNTLEIDVTNLQANRIADYERRGVEWRRFKDANIASVTNAREFSFGDWPTVPAGLCSDVTLTPVRLSTSGH